MGNTRNHPGDSVPQGNPDSLWSRTADLRAKIQQYPVTGLLADKAFFDELSDDRPSLLLKKTSRFANEA